MPIIVGNTYNEIKNKYLKTYEIGDIAFLVTFCTINMHTYTIKKCFN